MSTCGQYSSLFFYYSLHFGSISMQNIGSRCTRRTRFVSKKKIYDNSNCFRTQDIIAVMYAYLGCCQIKAKQKQTSSLNVTYDRCDTNAVLYQLSKFSTENLFILFADCMKCLLRSEGFYRCGSPD